MSVQKCPFNHEKLVAYSSGNLQTKERVLVERHLAQCSICRMEVRNLEQIWWSLDVWDFEPQHSQPRLKDLHRRIAATKQSKPFWLHYSENVMGWFTSVRPVPALAMATILSALFMLPVLQSSLFNQVSDQPPVFANQGDNTPESATVAEAASNPETVSDDEHKAKRERLSREFNLVVRNASGDTYPGIRKPMVGHSYTPVGFAPGKDYFSVPGGAIPNKPYVTANQVVQGDRIKLGY
jgi:anti-sigma factor RsiW